MMAELFKYDYRRRLNMLTNVARVCAALQVSWGPITEELQQKIPASDRIAASEIDATLAEASAPHSNAWFDRIEQKIRDERRVNRASEPLSVPVRVAMLEWEPFTSHNHWGTAFPDAQDPSDKGFFFEFCRLLVQRVDPCIDIEAEFFDDFEEMHSRLRASSISPDGFQLAIGLLPTNFRRRSLNLEFIPIPGLRVRLVCLAASDTADRLRWRHVWDAFRQGHSAEVRVITTRASVADSFLRDYPHPNLADTTESAAVIPNAPYSPEALVDSFSAESRKPGPPCVILADEIAAAAARAVLLSRGTALVELPEDGPSFELSLAVPKSETRWGEEIQTAINEQLFDVYPVETAEVYLSFFRRAFRQHIVWKKQDKPFDYLRLRDFANTTATSDRFWTTLHSGLVKLLSEFAGFGANPSDLAADALPAINALIDKEFLPSLVGREKMIRQLAKDVELVKLRLARIDGNLEQLLQAILQSQKTEKGKEHRH
jgi:hypothetical protein